MNKQLLNLTKSFLGGYYFFIMYSSIVLFMFFVSTCTENYNEVYSVKFDFTITGDIDSAGIFLYEEATTCTELDRESNKYNYICPFNYEVITEFPYGIKNEINGINNHYYLIKNFSISDTLFISNLIENKTYTLKGRDSLIIISN